MFRKDTKKHMSKVRLKTMEKMIPTSVGWASLPRGRVTWVYDPYTGRYCGASTTSFRGYYGRDGETSDPCLVGEMTRGGRFRYK